MAIEDIDWLKKQAMRDAQKQVKAQEPTPEEELRMSMSDFVESARELVDVFS